MMKTDAVVVGAGIWGCTVARRFTESGRKLLVPDSALGAIISLR